MKISCWLLSLTLFVAWALASSQNLTLSSFQFPSAPTDPSKTILASSTSTPRVTTIAAAPKNLKNIDAETMPATKPASHVVPKKLPVSESKKLAVPEPVKKESEPAKTPTALPPEPAPITEPIPAPTLAPAKEAPANSFQKETESQIIALSNAERTKNGLSSLSADSSLSSISWSHSADMLAQDYFSHTDPDGCGSSCRANKAEYAWRSIGENIYMSSGYDLVASEIAKMVVDGWMSSPGPRANILGAQYSHTGVGIFVQGESVYVTAMYSKPR